MLASNVQGTPVAHSPEDLTARGLSTCQVVSDVVSVLHNPALSASATKFCSSFISIPLKTATSASTATITPAPVTTTTTVIVPTTTVVTSTLGLPLTTAAPAIKEKRAGSLAPYLTAFASSKISAACSCLSITPSTTTIKSTATVTASASTATVTTTSTSTVISTSTVLGAASQCLPAAITASPARLFQPGVVAIAGTAQECVLSRYKQLRRLLLRGKITTLFLFQDPGCNIDNEQPNFTLVLDSPSTTNTCRIYRDGFGDCANDVSVFTSGEPALSGEVNNFGIGPCTPEIDF
ncbi:MAG: hypothetical protein Q9195_000899 [Heterodermia aff. obscurata]